METFTADEIAEIVHELNLPAEIEVDENQGVSVEVKADDFEWNALLGDRGRCPGGQDRGHATCLAAPANRQIHIT